MYLIDGKQFRLKDLTLEDEEKISKITGKATFSNGLNLSSADLITLLKLVLEPVNEKEKIDKVNFAKCTQKTYVTVLKDFFSQKIKEQSDLINYFKELKMNADTRNANMTG